MRSETPFVFHLKFALLLFWGLPAAAQKPVFSTDSGPRKPVRATSDCIVDRISDGDTFACRKLGRVRLIGIDAPETDQKPMGQRSADALRALLPIGSTVRLELDVGTHDQYRRTLAYVWANGRMVNWVMVRSGWTSTITVPPNVQYVREFSGAMQKARNEKLGLWHDDAFRCMPAEHRRKRC